MGLDGKTVAGLRFCQLEEQYTRWKAAKGFQPFAARIFTDLGPEDSPMSVYSMNRTAASKDEANHEGVAD